MVHRVNGKNEGKAACDYKHTSRIWSYSSTLKKDKKKKTHSLHQFELNYEKHLHKLTKARIASCTPSVSNLYCQCKTPKNANSIDSRGNYAEMARSVMLP